MYLSVNFCISSSAFLWSSLVISLDFSSFLNSSLASLLIFLTAIFEFSTSFLTSLIKSFLLSSVQGGITRLLSLPSCDGVVPTSVVWVGFSLWGGEWDSEGGGVSGFL